MGTSEVTHCFWKQLSWFFPSLLCDFHASQRWRCQNTTKSYPWYKAAARGWFQTSSSSRCSRRKRSGKRCCVQFPLCCVGRALTALSRCLGRLIPATLLPVGGGLCPWERKDNAAVPPGVTGSASRPACPRTAALSSGRVPPPEQTPPPANRREIRLGSCILGTDPKDTWGGLGNNQFVPL